MVTKLERLQVLERQVARLQRRIHRLEQSSDRYSWVRVGIFFGGLALSGLIFFAFNRWLGTIFALLTMLAFLIVAHFHNKVERSLTRHTQWQRIKSTHIARLHIDWDMLPDVPPSGVLTDHPFETDLDITGPRSLHQLLNTAVSREGGMRLRDWLLSRTPDLPTIQQRQALVRELTTMTLFRDRLTLNALLARRNIVQQLEGDRLLRWVNQPPPSSSLLPLIWGSIALSALTILFFVLNLFLALPQIWVFTLACSFILFFTTARLRGDLFDDASYLRYAFAALGTVFEYLEQYRYGSHEQLKQLCAPFFSEPEQRPSVLLKRLARIASMASLERNVLLRVIVNILVPWEAYGAHRLRQYKAQLAHALPTWLDRWFELEALGALANFAYLNPAYTLPEIVATAFQDPQTGVMNVAPASHDNTQTIFHAEAIGHPLLADEKKVTNDVTFARLGETIIITGSNMSGKSTFLRTLGVNLVLAYAGGPVNARCLHTQAFRLFTCIRVSDSVTDGYSYFYAEVRRLKALLTELEQNKPFPLFFLIDEIFRGTNNRERLIGSRAYIRALAGHFCMGAIATHDLELVGLADTIPDILNAHFREEVVNGQMIFDYRLRSGPSPTTNALKIMHMAGLPVDESDTV